LNSYHPDQVFSSIDTQGRYSFGNQARIILWNLSVFASTLSDFIDEAVIKEVLGKMEEQMEQKWLVMICRKIGISTPVSIDETLITKLLSWMQKH
jgi:serine/tyrosine/threonine adenylyltransferase